MVHKKYRIRGGKVYGPYLYENVRVGNRIITKYIGKAPAEEPHRNIHHFVWIALGVALLIFLAIIPLQLTGKFSSEAESVYEIGEELQGSLSLLLWHGELIPASTIVTVVNGNQSVSKPLDSLLDNGLLVEDVFFLEGSELTGSGQGFGVAGHTIERGEVSFTLLINADPPVAPPVFASGSGTEENQTEENASLEEAVNNSEIPSAEEPPLIENETDDSLAEDTLEETTTQEIPSDSSGEESIDLDDSTGELPAESDIPVSPAQDEESSQSDASDSSSESPVENEDFSDPGASSESEESGSSPDSSSPDSSSDSSGESSSSSSDGSSGLTGSVISEESFTVEGSVRKGESFSYSLAEGQYARVVAGSVRIGELVVEDSLVNLVQTDGEVTVSTDYENSTSGFGSDFIESDQNRFFIDLASFSLVALSPVLEVSFAYENTTLRTFTHLLSIEGLNSTFNETNLTLPLSNVTSNLSLFKEIPTVRILANQSASLIFSDYFSGATTFSVDSLENISALIEGDTLTFIPDAGFKGSRRTRIHAYAGDAELISNEFMILVSSGGVSLTTSRDAVVIGQPVRWVVNVTLEVPEEVVVDLLPSAHNITIQKNDEEQLVASSATITPLTGMSFSEREFAWVDVEKKGLFTRLFERASSSGITARVVDERNEQEIFLPEDPVEENISTGNEGVAVVLEDNATEYIIEYYTAAPVAVSYSIPRGIGLQVSAPDELNYTDVLAYTSIPQVVALGSEFSIILYWVENKSALAFDAYDLDANTLIDYLEWNVPHLSNQTFEIILITKAEHLDENRTRIEDIYEEVKARDGIWKAIPAGHYVRVVFERNLSAHNDITLYARSNTSGVVEVYGYNDSELLATFEEIAEDRAYKILLTNLTTPEAMFDLHIVNGEIEFDWIVDPTATIIINAPINNSDVLPPFAVLNWSVGNVTSVTVYASNNTDTLWSSPIYFSSNGGNSTLTYNWSAPVAQAGSTSVAIYHFDNLSSAGESQILAYDFANGDNNLTLVASDINESGRLARAIELRGVLAQRNVSTVDSAVFDIPSQTIMGWFMIKGAGDGADTGTGGLSNIRPLVAKCRAEGESAAQDVAFFIGINASGTLVADFENNSASMNFPIRGTTVLANNVWYHFAYVVVAAQTQTLYINGMVEFHNASMLGTPEQASGCRLGIGQTYNNAGAVDGAFNGSIDEIVILNTSLSASAIAAYYNLSSGTKYWAVNVTNSTDAMVSSGIYQFNLGTDATTPTTTLVAPSNGSVVAIPSQTFNATFSDNTGLANATFYLWNSTTLVNTTTQALSGLSGSINLTVTLPQANIFFWNYQVADTGNNYAFATTNFTIIYDASAPLISFVSPTPANASTQSSSTVGVSVSSTDFADHYTFTDFDDSLKLWMRMDDINASGDPIDLSKYSFNGSAINTSVTLSGKFNASFVFNGTVISNNHIVTNDNSGTELVNELSISAWFKTNATNNHMIIAKHLSGTSGSWFLGLPTGGTQIQFSMINSTPTRVNHLVSVNYHENAWHHVVAVYNGSAMMIYFDGTVQGTPSAHSGLIQNTTYPIRIGSFDSFNSWVYNGSIDEVLIFNRTLSAGEVSSLYNASATQYARNFSALSDGIHQFRAYAVDVGGYKNQTEQRFVTIDTTVPLVTINQPATDVFALPVLFNVTLNENGAACNYTLDSGLTNYTMQNNGNRDFNASNASMTEAAYTVQYFCWDSAANNLNGTQTRSFTLNDVPQIRYITPTPNDLATHPSQHVYVNVSSSDLSTHYAFTNFDRSLLGWWTFDNDTTAYPFDLSGYGNNGSYAGNAVKNTTSCIYGNCSTFDANGDYMVVANASFFNISGNLTLAAWFNANGFASAMTVISKPINGPPWSSPFTSWLLRINSASTIEYGISNGASYSGVTITTLSLATNRWYHIAMTYNGTERVLYLNGTQIARSTALTGRLGYGNIPVLIGADHGASPAGDYFNGSIDDVLIFNRSLSSGEIAVLFNATATQYQRNFTALTEGYHSFSSSAVDLRGNKNSTEVRTVLVDSAVPQVAFVSPTGANNSILAGSVYINVSSSDANKQYTFVDIDKSNVLWLRMDDLNSTGGVLDLSAYARNATPYLNPAQVKGMFNKSLLFNNVDLNYLDLGVQPEFNLTKALTIAAWVNVTADTITYRPILYRTTLGTPCGSSAPYCLFVEDAATDRLKFQQSNTTTFLVDLTSSTSLTEDTWQHAAVTVNTTNPSNITVTMYINGTIVGFASYSGVPADAGSHTYVGGWPDDFASFEGAIDDLLVFNRTLTQDEIQALYDGATSQYSRNFTTLFEPSEHVWRAHIVDIAGNKNSTDHRTLFLGAQPVLACGVKLDTPGRIYGLSGNLSSSSGVCINITASNVTFNGYGFSLIDLDQGFSLEPGIYSSYTSNITIRNVSIEKYTQALYFYFVNQSFVQDIFAYQARKQGIVLYDSVGNDFSRISLKDVLGTGVYFTGSLSRSHALYNFSINNTFGSALGILPTGSGEDINLSGFIIINSTNLDLNATFGTVINIRYIDSLLHSYLLGGSQFGIRNSRFGEVFFTLGISPIGSNLSSEIQINNNSAFFNASNANLNSSANITLLNLPTSFTDPVVLRNGIVCPSTVCYNFTSLNAGNVKFNVSSGATYNVSERTTTAPANPSVFINSTDGSNRTLQDLHCFATISDVDLSLLNVTVRWYNNSVQHLLVNYNNSYASGTFFDAVLDDGNTTKNHNWTCGIQVTDGTLSSALVNSSALRILNTPPIVTLDYPADGNITTNRTPIFAWIVLDHDDESTLAELNVTLRAASTCSDSVQYIQGISTASYTLTRPLRCLADNNDYYLWSARANDSEAYGSWTATRTINLSAVVSITLPTSAINFGSLAVRASNDTTDDSPGPFVIENEGNALANITLSGSSLWITSTNPTAYYQYKIDNYTGHAGAFKSSGSAISFQNVPSSSSLSIAELNYSYNKSRAEIDLYVEVPSNEPPNVRNSTITFVASLAE